MRTVVWVAGTMHEKEVSSSSEAASLVPWLEERVRAQRAAAKEASEEEARKRALPLPPIEDVLAALRGGKRIVVYAGRAGKTYFMNGGALRCDFYEEADRWEDLPASEEELARDIALYPDAFREL